MTRHACPHCRHSISRAHLAAMLGAAKSPAKTAAARINAKQGGRPWTCDRCGEVYPPSIPPGSRGTTRAGRWRVCVACHHKAASKFARGVA